MSANLVCGAKILQNLRMCKKNRILMRFFLCMVSSVGGKFSLVDAPLALLFSV